MSSRRSIIPDLAALIADLEVAKVDAATILEIVKKRLAGQQAAPSVAKVVAKAVVKRHRRTKAELEAAKKLDAGLAAVKADGKAPSVKEEFERVAEQIRHGA